MAFDKFKFKRGKKPTGLRAVGEPYASVDIKIGKNVVGIITPPTWSSKENSFLIRFMVKDSSERIGWKWIQLKFRGNEQEARDFIVKNNDEIQSRYDLHFLEVA